MNPRLLPPALAALVLSLYPFGMRGSAQEKPASSTPAPASAQPPAASAPAAPSGELAKLEARVQEPDPIVSAVMGWVTPFLATPSPALYERIPSAQYAAAKQAGISYQELAAKVVVSMNAATALLKEVDAQRPAAPQNNDPAWIRVKRDALIRAGDAHLAGMKFSGASSHYKNALPLASQETDWEKWSATAWKLSLANIGEGREADAETLLRTLMAEHQKRAADSQIAMHVTSLLSNVIADRGDFQTAHIGLGEVIKAYESKLGATHPQTLMTVGDLAVVHRRANDFDTAETLGRRAVVGWEQAKDASPPEAARALESLAFTLEKKGQFPEAEGLYKKALAINTQIFGAEHVVTVYCQMEFALLYHEMGNAKAAQPMLRAAAATADRAWGAESQNALRVQFSLARALRESLNTAEAESILRRILEIQQRTLGPAHRDAMKTTEELVQVLTDRNDLAGLEQIYRKGAELIERAVGADHEEALAANLRLASFLTAKGDLAGAETLFRKISDAQVRDPKADAPAIFLAQTNLARLIARRGRSAEALIMAESARDGLRKKLGEQNDATVLAAQVAEQLKAALAPPPSEVR